MPPLGTPTIRYVIATGHLTVSGQTFSGYAGKGMWINDPDSTDEVSRGPLPCGTYRLHKPVRHPRLGPLSIRLEPVPGTEMFGRSGFFIHGDNARGDRSASSGCIVVNRVARETIARLLVREPQLCLVVIPR